jgi:hypothetical protein
MITISAVPRILACPGSAHLPQAPYSTTEAVEGTGRHAEQEAVADLIHLPGGDLHPDVAALVQPGDRLRSELAVAYDVGRDTGVILDGVSDRQYGDRGPFEIPGTIDLLIGSHTVVDYKGYEPAADGQVETYALAVARALGLSEIRIAIVYLPGLLPTVVRTMTALDFDMHAARLRAMVGSASRELVEGRQCRYCPSFLACPKQTVLTKEVDTMLPIKIETMIPFESDADAAEAFDLLARIKILTTRIQAALYARAGERPFRLSSGKMLGPVTKQGNERLDGDVTYEVVREAYGQAKADAAVTRVATKVRLKDALGAAEQAKVIKTVRERGGSKQETKTSVGEYES